MKTLIAVLTLLLSSIPALAQSACGQLGVDCRHPTVAPRPSPPSNGGTQSDSSDDSGVSHREYKNFYKSVDLGDKARKNKDKNPAQALHYLDEALALRRVSGETRKQDHWAWLECERATVLIKLGRYDDALGSFSQCAGEDITDKNQEAYQQWVKWGEQAVEADKNPWAPLAVEVTGDVTVIGMDGREWHGDFEHANLKFATIKVAPNAKFKMLLPDETVFTILLSDIGAEIEMDDFVYDSNFDLQVLLWGTVVEHEHGWRAQFAYPKTLHLPCDTLPVTLAEMESRLHSLVPYRCKHLRRSRRWERPHLAKGLWASSRWTGFLDDQRQGMVRPAQTPEEPEAGRPHSCRSWYRRCRACRRASGSRLVEERKAAVAAQGHRLGRRQLALGVKRIGVDFSHARHLAH